MVVKHPSLPLTSESVADAPAKIDGSPLQTAPTKTKAPPSELLVMGRIERLVEQLPEQARGRVIRWVFEKWCDGKDVELAKRLHDAGFKRLGEMQ